jgi:RNA polymerase sigma-54 factor
MQQIADALGIHESTVSRAIANKYIFTPHGLFDLKYFFSTGIESAGGESVSTTNIKRIIQQMVAQENPQSPLTDQEIIEKLAAQGVHLARRTVSKYRKNLSILPSNLRRKY